MAGVWSIIVPQKTEFTNLVTNPSFEVSNSGWTAVGAGSGVSSSISSFSGTSGYYRGYVSVGANAGGAYTTVSLVTGTTYTFALDFQGATAGSTFEMYFATNAGVLEGTKHTFVCTTTAGTYWQRESVTWACNSTATHRLYIVNDSTHSENFSIDAVSCVATALELTYFDGDTPNCRWTSGWQSSTSVCEVWARNVGVVTDLLDYNLRVLSVDGVGMTDSTHQIAQYATMPGAEYKGHKVQPRYITLTNAVYGTSLENLHSKRKDIVDLFQHDVVAGDQPITLRYTGANSLQPIDITCYLDQEIGAFDLPKVQRNAIRLVCYDPYFYDIWEDATTIAAVQNFDSKSTRYFACKRNGDWTSITPSAVTDPGSGIKVRDIEIQGSYYKTVASGSRSKKIITNERIYVSGYYLNWNGTAASDYICYYDVAAGTWNAVEAGTNGYVRSMAIAPNGYIYACGEFTQIGATAANRIAYWNGAAWVAMGTGFDGTAYDVLVANDGKVYAVGNDATIGGVASAAYVAYWDGAAWNAMSTGISAAAYSLASDNAGNIYIGGSQTGYVTKWNGTTLTSLAAPALCWALKVAPNGTVYAGLAGSEYIKMWNGQAWVSMAGGVTAGNFIYGLDIDANGMLWAGGDFTAVGGLTVNGLACWNGYSWVYPDIQLPASSIVYTVRCNGNDIYLGFDTTGTSFIPSNQPITNSGTARAYPEIKINRPTGTVSTNLRYLRNETTNKTIYFDYDIQLGETLYLNFAEVERSIVSSFYGNVWRAVLRGSQFTDFYLVPGANRIYLFVYNTYLDGATNSYIKFTPRHESIDGAAV